jgi:hypothetical protein
MKIISFKEDLEVIHKEDTQASGVHFAISVTRIRYPLDSYAIIHNVDHEKRSVLRALQKNTEDRFKIGIKSPHKRAGLFQPVIRQGQGRGILPPLPVSALGL